MNEIMATAPDETIFARALSESPTWVGTNPDDASPVTLTDDDLLQTCYIEGTIPDQQTALCHRLCVQWAHADRGFCYISPHCGPPLDLLYALPTALRMSSGSIFRVPTSVHASTCRKPSTSALTPSTGPRTPSITRRLHEIRSPVVSQTCWTCSANTRRSTGTSLLSGVCSCPAFSATSDRCMEKMAFSRVLRLRILRKISTHYLSSSLA